MRWAVVALLGATLLAAGCSTTPEVPRPTLRVVTLNLRHARGPGSGRVLQDVDAFRERVAAVAEVLRRENVDVAGFQEADGVSVWSGGFDHVGSIAEAVGWGKPAFGPYGRMKTSGGKGVEYGSAVISRLPLRNVDWAGVPGPPLDEKGYVVATVKWQGREIDIVSLHLHAVMSAFRLDQARLIAGELLNRGRPMIVVGDFNCGWTDREKTLLMFAGELQLSTWEPDAEDLGTHPMGRANRRLDWILVTPELEILEERILPDRLSDHHAVLADIAWR